MLSSHQFCDKTPGGSSCHHFCSPVSVFNPAAILMPPVCTQLFWCHPSLYKVHTTFLPSCTGFSTDYLSLLPPSHVISCHSSLSCPYSTFPSRWVQCTLVLCAHPFCLEILFFSRGLCKVGPPISFGKSLLPSPILYSHTKHHCLLSGGSAHL